MGSIASALRLAKRMGPKTLAMSALRGPRAFADALTRALAPQVVAFLQDMFDEADDETAPMPSNGFSHPPAAGPAPHVYTNMASHIYTNMASRVPSQPVYVNSTPNGRFQPPAASPSPYVHTNMTPRNPIYANFVTPGTSLPQVAPQPAYRQPAASAAPDLSAVPQLPLPQSYQGEDANGVKYIFDLSTRMQKYEVNIAPVLTRRGIALDTEAVKDHFFANRSDPLKAAQKKRADLGLANLEHGSGPARFTQLMKEWGYGSLIWVCVREMGSNVPAFYSHVGKVHRFHHSSFTGGGDVIGAGEWIVEKGHLRKISGNSGHYRPPLDFFHRAVLYMANAWHDDTVVLLWNKQQNTWEEVPIQVFKSNAGGGGKWTTHPLA